MIIFLDSFDHYARADMGFKWTHASGSNLTIGSGSGRFGNGASYFDDGSNFSWVVLPEDDTWTVGFALKPVQLNTTTFMLFRELAANVTHVDLGVDGANRIKACRNGTTLGTGTTVMNTAVWYYIEIQFTVHDSAGTVEVRVNGVPEITLTGQDTRNGGTGIIDQLYCRGIGGIGTGLWHLDDLYVLDSVDSGVSGKPNNDFLGDIRVEATLPNGNGNSSQLDGSDGNSTDNYLLVDEAAQDGNTTYVESTSPGDKDTYAFGDLSAVVAGSIYGVQILPFSRKTEAGTRTICTVARHSGTEEDGDDHGLSTSYQYFRSIREEKPGGGGWALSEFNNAEFGVKVTA